MSNHYQQLTKYTGSLYGTPRYQGIEYDWEVPDNLVVGSPGGVSSVHHHYTKGFYGRGETSSDIYAGQDQRYNAGEYGNLYQTGQTAAQNMGYYLDAPDYKYWKNEEPQQYSYSKQQPGRWKPQKENFEVSSDPSFELISPSDDPVQETKASAELSIRTKVSPWLILLLLFLIFIVFYCWALAGDRFLVQYVHDGKKPSWQRMAVYAVAITLVLVLILSAIGCPMISVKG